MKDIGSAIIAVAVLIGGAMFLLWLNGWGCDQTCWDYWAKKNQPAAAIVIPDRAPVKTPVVETNVFRVVRCDGWRGDKYWMVDNTGRTVWSHQERSVGAKFRVVSGQPLWL